MNPDHPDTPVPPSPVPGDAKEVAEATPGAAEAPEPAEVDHLAELERRIAELRGEAETLEVTERN
ncbi:MAG: hypothetical protein AAGG01_05250, partial [Planctomycetota bacterium]